VTMEVVIRDDPADATAAFEATAVRHHRRRRSAATAAPRADAVGPPASVARGVRDYAGWGLGSHVGLPRPFDLETIERLGEVRAALGCGASQRRAGQNLTDELDGQGAGRRRPRAVDRDAVGPAARRARSGAGRGPRPAAEPIRGQPFAGACAAKPPRAGSRQPQASRRPRAELRPSCRARWWAGRRAVRPPSSRAAFRTGACNRRSHVHRTDADGGRRRQYAWLCPSLATQLRRLTHTG
jgi:hypothetical protein